MPLQRLSIPVQGQASRLRGLDRQRCSGHRPLEEVDDMLY